MKSLGIELKGNSCIGVLIDASGAVLETVKFELTDSYDQESVNAFHSNIQSFLNDQSPNVLVIKKRNEKGKFAGGAVSFKMEGLIQIASSAKNTFVSGAQLNAFSKNISDFPEVKKYQEQALICAIFGLNI